MENRHWLKGLTKVRIMTSPHQTSSLAVKPSASSVDTGSSYSSSGSSNSDADDDDDDDDDDEDDESLRSAAVVKKQPGTLKTHRSKIIKAQPGAQASGVSVSSAGWLPTPPGLEALVPTDHVFVRQQEELFEALCSCETTNQYEILDSTEQKLYRAYETSSCCCRACCGPRRPLTIKVNDPKDSPIMFMHRPLRFASCFCPCCLQYMVVEAPKGQQIGRIVQNWSCLRPWFRVEKEDGSTVMRIKGQLCYSKCCGAKEFQIISVADGETIGKLSKHWSGAIREFFTDADNFGVCFPIDLDPRLKATLLGAVFLIDYMYFEDTHKRTSTSLDL